MTIVTFDSPPRSNFIYCSPTGSDTAYGLSTDERVRFSRALELIKLKLILPKLDSDGRFNLIMGNGDYDIVNDAYDVSGIDIGFGLLNIKSESENNTAVVFRSSGTVTFICLDGCNVRFDKVQIETPNGGLVYAGGNSRVYFESVCVGDHLDYAFDFNERSFADFSGASKFVAANPDGAIRARNNSHVDISGHTFNFNSVAYLCDYALLLAESGGKIHAEQGAAFTNAVNVTGRKWIIQTGGKININPSHDGEREQSDSELNAAITVGTVDGFNLDSTPLGKRITLTQKTLSALEVLADPRHAFILKFDPDGANRDVRFPFVAGAPDMGYWVLIENQDGAFDLNIQQDDSTPIFTLNNTNGTTALFYYNGNTFDVVTFGGGGGGSAEATTSEILPVTANVQLAANASNVMILNPSADGFNVILPLLPTNSHKFHKFYNFSTRFGVNILDYDNSTLLGVLGGSVSSTKKFEGDYVSADWLVEFTGSSLGPTSDLAGLTQTLAFVDENQPTGLFYFMGTQNDSIPYATPDLITVDTYQSTLSSGRGAEQAINRNTSLHARTIDLPNGWFAYVLRDGWSLYPTHIELQSSEEIATDYPVTISFQGTNDVIPPNNATAAANANWTVIAVLTFTLNTPDEYQQFVLSNAASVNSYTGFRFEQTAQNSSGNDYFTLGGIEIFGQINISSFP